MLPMSSLTRPSSPIQADSHPQIAHSHDTRPPSSRAHSFPYSSHPDMGHPKTRSHLEIVLDTQYITLRGTGVDVEPSRLSGHVVLHLSEDTALKGLTLRFRGKSRIPTTPSETLVASNTSLITNVIYNHEWSFLEGDNKHVHTVKAGRHVFPFHLQIDGSLPSSLQMRGLGASSIYYKLRAVAARPGLNLNLRAVTPVQIDRSFSHEALEYQQSLENEGTWRDKLMYSVILPHKAWAAGDQLVAVFKLSPTSKGVFVTQVKTVIQETTRVYARTGVREDTRNAACARHDIIGGKPVYSYPPQSQSHSPANLVSASQSQNAIAGPSTVTTPGGETSSSSQASSSRAPSFFSPLPSPVESSTTSLSSEEPNPEENNDLVMTIPLKIPPHSPMPTHSLEPIVVTHRIRWHISIRNLDGHASELRCSLPIHILHHRFLEEARSCSLVTRRLLLGSSELPPDEEEDRELPSYDAHIRDRVANMFLPDGATVRVNNPWINRSIPPTPHNESGYSTPLELPHTTTTTTLSHLPHVPDSGDIDTLNLLNSELLVSLTDSPLRREFLTLDSATHTPPPDHPTPASQSQSRNHSQPHSRHNSRPPSPDGREGGGGGGGHHSRGHSRDFRHLFRATMRPFTALSQKRHDDHHHHSDQPPEQSSPLPLSASSSQQQHPVNAVVPDHIDGAELLHRAFTEVPDYSIASRGFIGGGVPPLDCMRGLPSYEEAAREGAQERETQQQQQQQQEESSDLDLVTEGIAGMGIGDDDDVDDDDDGGGGGGNEPDQGEEERVPQE